MAFIQYNTLTRVTATVDPALPTSEVDYREIKVDAMIRCGPCWFRFVSMLEAMYVSNLTTGMALHHKGDVITAIAKSVKSSEPLRNPFAVCIPPDFDKEQRKIMWRLYFSVALECYAKMKAEDILKKIKASQILNGANTIVEPAA